MDAKHAEGEEGQHCYACEAGCDEAYDSCMEKCAGTNEETGEANDSAACELAFSQWQLLRIFAYVFDGNIASDRVLLKNGFRHEGPHATPPTKDGRTIACQVFDLTRPTHEGN